MARLLTPSPQPANMHKSRHLLSSKAVQDSEPLPSHDRLYLTKSEVEILIETAKRTRRNKTRNALIFLLLYRHGLRVGELVDLRWTDIDFPAGLIYIRRLKNGICTHHALERDELQGLHVLQRSLKLNSFVFNSEFGTPLTEDGVRKMVARVGIAAKLPFHCHPHQLRHSCGVHLAAKGIPLLVIKAYLGHWDIRTTLHYADLSQAQSFRVWS